MLSFVSCDDSKYEPSPEQDTTIELQNLPKDTIVVSEKGDYLYQFNEENLVEARYIIELENSAVILTGGVIFIFFVGLVFGFIIGLSILD